MKKTKKPTQKVRKDHGRSRKGLRKNPLKPADLAGNLASIEHIAGDMALQFATRGMSLPEKAVLCALIETVIRPILGKVSNSALAAAVTEFESERREGSYEQCR
jgi:hypothetical protein